MTMLDFDGRVVLVTGGGRGMGAAHCAELARRGARIVVNDLGGDVSGHGTDSAPAEEVASAIRDAGGEAIAHAGTVATEEGCAAMIAACISHFGRLDGVLHNAGNATWMPIAEMSEAAFDDVLRVHLYAAANLTRLAWPHLRDGGRLLYITSGAGLYGSPTLAHYAAAKVGLVGLMRVVASEGGGTGIAANALAVCASTRMMDEVLADAPNMLDWFNSYMHPHLPSAVAVWLLHPDCGVSGHVYEAFGPHVARVLIAETTGFTKLDMTAEDVRDHMPEIEDRENLFIPEGPDDYHARMFQSVIRAGAEAPQTDNTVPAPMRAEANALERG